MSRERRIVLCVAVGAGVLFAALLGAIGWAALQGPIGEGFAVVTSNPWGWVTLLDLYLGLALITAWIWALERSWRRAAVWAVALACTGNLATLVYLAWRARRARCVRELWLGP